MSLYKITKEASLDKVVSILTLSCIYNITPELEQEVIICIMQIYKTKTNKIKSLTEDNVRILELEEWHRLHREGDSIRLTQKVEFLKRNFDIFKVKKFFFNFQDGKPKDAENTSKFI